jgi:hypothetical protein
VLSGIITTIHYSSATSGKQLIYLRNLTRLGLVPLTRHWLSRLLSPATFLLHRKQRTSFTWLTLCDCNAVIARKSLGFRNRFWEWFMTFRRCRFSHGDEDVWWSPLWPTLLTDRRFRGVYCLQHKGDGHEAVNTSQVSVSFYISAWPNIPEDSHLLVP